MQPTALVVTVPVAPGYVRGSDGRTHIDYDLLVTNWIPGTVTLRSIEVLTSRGQPLLRLTGDALARHTHLLSATPPAPPAPSPPATVVASGAVATVIDVAVPPRALPTVLTHRITYDLPSNLDPHIRPFIGSRQVNGPRLRLDRHPPAVIAAPLHGPGWINAVGCCQPWALHRSLLYGANGRWVKGETFAIDWLQLRNGSPFAGDGSRNDQWYDFGAPLLAVAGGTVVKAVDGKPDIAPNAPPILATPEDYLGNYVVVRIRPGVFAEYAHVQRGSVQVRVGQRVRAGQQLGKLGNSGNTTAPHLHFGLIDGPNPTTTNSLPMEFDQFRFVGVLDPDTGQISGTPRPMQRTYPLLYTVVDFD
ncbi:MAG: M23 family metallopeptidase [Actinomycetes bacterium]